MDNNYKAYSLQEIETWVRESLEADCTPKEIYDSIIDTVKNNMKYHRACYRDSVKLLSLLRGNRNELEVHETFGGTVSVESPEDVSSEYFNDYYTHSLDSRVLGEDIIIDTDK